MDDIARLAQGLINGSENNRVHGLEYTFRRLVQEPCDRVI
jgi:hypothetical protein